MTGWLLDTGPIVAYLDPDDRDHRRVGERLDSFAGSLFTTGAVITEAMHLVRRRQQGFSLVAQFASTASIQVEDYAQPPALLRAAELMERYRDLPMDYADATLVLLAEDLGLQEVPTLDRRGFSAFRTPSGGPLINVLDLA
jgi:predicted nucleic acid-binding protein